MRSFVALLVISSFAYLALSQSACGTAPTGCASCAPSTSTSTSNYCTSCNTGYMLSGAPSTCGTGCSAGCATCQNSTVCTACLSGYALSSSACLACNATATGGSVGCTTCTAASGNTTCTVCASGYVLGTNYCWNCAASTTNNAVIWIGVANCVACTFTATTNTTSQVSTGPVGNWLTCTQCASGYGIPTTNLNAAISTPECANFVAGSAAFITNDGNGAAAAGDFLAATAAFPTACTQATLVAPGSAGPFTVGLCTQSTSGSWCGGVAGTVTCSTSAPTSSGWVTPTNCLGGLYTAAAASATTPVCQFCATNYTLISGACVANTANCAWMTSSTACGTAATGYTITSTGTIVACSSSTTTACAGGSPTGTYLASNGSYLTGTTILNCWYHNSTSFCVQCAPGYASSAPSCVACPSNCNTCSSNTTCTACATTYLLQTNGTCTFQNCTNVTSNGTCVYSKNLVASGLAFVSMVFYYLF